MLHIIDTEYQPGRVANQAMTKMPALNHADDVTVTVASSYDRHELLDVLDRRAHHTAFDLVGLEAEGDAADRWSATFRLRAAHGVVGDTQIYALLRFLTGDVRWLNVTKGADMGAPDKVVSLAGDSHLSAS